MGVRAHYRRYENVVAEWLEDHPDDHPLVGFAARGGCDEAFVESVREDPEELWIVPGHELDAAQFERFVASEAFESARGYHDDMAPDGPYRADIDKAWAGLHRLLTGQFHRADSRAPESEQGDGEPPASWIVVPPQFQGEGRAVGVLDADKTAQIVEWLDDLDASELRERYDTFLEGESYYGFQVADPFDYLMSQYDRLAYLLRMASREGDALTMTFSY